MPSDYASTARALSLNADDGTTSPSRSRSPIWRRPGSSSLPRHSSSSLPQGNMIQARMRRLYAQYERYGRTLYERLTTLQLIGLAVFSITMLVLGILFLVYNHRIFAWLGPAAKKWRDVPGGWLLLWLATFFVSFPPMIGYSTCVTMAGIVYGMNGWFIASTATIIGSTASFVASRRLYSGFVQRLVQNDKRFAALSLTLKDDGLKLLCMIRLCPLPYSLSNGAIATFPTVTWKNFMIATAVAAPKLVIHIFIGSRIGAIAENEEMDTKTKMINYCGILFGILLGIGTGIVVYRQCKKRAAELEAQEAASLAEGRPSEHQGRGYSDDPEQIRRGNLRGGRDDISLREQGDGEDDDAYRDYLSDPSEFDDDPFAADDEEMVVKKSSR